MGLPRCAFRSRSPYHHLRKGYPEPPTHVGNRHAGPPIVVPQAAYSIGRGGLRMANRVTEDLRAH